MNDLRMVSAAWQRAILMAVIATVLSGCETNHRSTASQPSRAVVENLVRNWLKAWETGDRELLRSTLHARVQFSYPAARLDAAGTVVSFDEFHAAFRDTHVYLHQIIVDGGRFTAEYQFATTRKSTGRRQAAGTIAIGEVRDGKILLVKEYLDGRVSRMQESGELPVDEGAEPYPWPVVPPKS